MHAGAHRRHALGQEGAGRLPGWPAREHAELAGAAGRPQGARSHRCPRVGHRRRRADAGGPGRAGRRQRLSLTRWPQGLGRWTLEEPDRREEGAGRQSLARRRRRTPRGLQQPRETALRGCEGGVQAARRAGRAQLRRPVRPPPACRRVRAMRSHAPARIPWGNNPDQCGRPLAEKDRAGMLGRGGASWGRFWNTGWSGERGWKSHLECQRRLGGYRAGRSTRPHSSRQAHWSPAASLASRRVPPAPPCPVTSAGSTSSATSPTRTRTGSLTAAGRSYLARSTAPAGRASGSRASRRDQQEDRELHFSSRARFHLLRHR